MSSRSLPQRALLGLSFLCFLAASGFSAPKVLLPAQDPLAEKVKAWILPQIEAEFPKLSDKTIRIRVFHQSDSYFRTDVRKRDAFKSPKKRIYNLYYNPRFFDDPPSPEAIEAVLCHELVHLESYVDRSGFELLALATRYLTQDSFRIRYEKATDRGALERGHATGLKDFRTWIYEKLEGDELAKKRRTYLTPEEIDTWRESQQSEAGSTL